MVCPLLYCPTDPLNVRMKCDGSVTSPAFITRKIERPLKQQSRRSWISLAAMPSSPYVLCSRTAFVGLPNWPVKWWKTSSASRLPLKGWTPQSDQGSMAPARAHSTCHLLITRLIGCRDLAIGRGSFGGLIRFLRSSGGGAFSGNSGRGWDPLPLRSQR